MKGIGRRGTMVIGALVTSKVNYLGLRDSTDSEQ